MSKINWTLIASDITAALTTLSIIPYDKDTMQLINQAIPATWIPWVIKGGIVATLLLRFIGRKVSPTNPQPEPPKP